MFWRRIWANLRVLLVGLLMLTTAGSAFANGYGMGKDGAFISAYASSCSDDAGCGSAEEDAPATHCAICCSHQMVVDMVLPTPLPPPVAQAMAVFGASAQGLELAHKYRTLDPPRA